LNKKKDDQINQLKEEIQDMKSFMNEKDQEMQELLKSNSVFQYN
jgi:prefoldin subunit 5